MDSIQVQLLRLYQEGLGLKCISKAVGLTPIAVKKRLIKAGVYQGSKKGYPDLRSKPGGLANLTKEQREKILSLLDGIIAKLSAHV